MTKKQLKEESKLNAANAIIAKQIAHINKLIKLIEIQERQMKVMDTAINRKQTIIRYLENGEG